MLSFFIRSATFLRNIHAEPLCPLSSACPSTHLGQSLQHRHGGTPARAANAPCLQKHRQPGHIAAHRGTQGHLWKMMKRDSTPESGVRLSYS